VGPVPSLHPPHPKTPLFPGCRVWGACCSLLPHQRLLLAPFLFSAGVTPHPVFWLLKSLVSWLCFLTASLCPSPLSLIPPRKSQTVRCDLLPSYVGSFSPHWRVCSLTFSPFTPPRALPERNFGVRHFWPPSSFRAALCSFSPLRLGSPRFQSPILLFRPNLALGVFLHPARTFFFCLVISLIRKFV